MSGNLNPTVKKSLTYHKSFAISFLPDSWKPPIHLLALAFMLLIATANADRPPQQTSSALTASSFKFDRLSLEDGLSQSSIMSIHQDERGFMWFGTQDGLNRYDGYDFKVYKHDPRDPHSISNDMIQSISEDRNGNLWIGTQAGLNRFNPVHERFTRVAISNDNRPGMEKGGVFSVFEDSEGFIWARTRFGIVRLDPDSGLLYHFNEQDINPTGLQKGYFVTSILEDQRGHIWIGALAEADSVQGGLFRFDMKSGNFSLYQNDPENRYSLGSDRVSVIFQDNAGGLWIGTFGGGLNGLDVETGQFIRYQHNPEDPQSIGSNAITNIIQTNSGSMWIGTENGGLNHFCRKKGTFTSYEIPSTSKYGDWNNSIGFNFRYPNSGTMIADDENLLWIRNGYSELLVFDTMKKTMTRLHHNPIDPTTLHSTHISSLYRDRLSNIWVGSDMAGLAKYSRGKEKFVKISPNPSLENGLKSPVIWSIATDHQDNIWVGSGGGVNRIDRTSGQFALPEKTALVPGGTSDRLVRSMIADHSGNLWLGVRSVGLEHWNFKTGKMQRYQANSDDSTALSSYAILALHEPNSALGKELWIGTAGDGLNLLDRTTGKFKRFQYAHSDSTSLSNNGIRAILEDREGYVWVGTSIGLNRLDKKRQAFKRFFNDPKDLKSLSNNRIMSIHEDHFGNIWVGTYGGGLNYFDRESETFTHYREQDGLPNNVIYGILSDEKGHLWLSTNRGIAQFAIPPDLQNKGRKATEIRHPYAQTARPIIRNFTMADGLQSFEFNQGAFHRARNGELFFGGINGLNRFHPDSLQTSTRVSPILLTSFKKADKSVNINRLLASNPVIELDYSDNIFSIGFVMLDYANPGRNQYAYRLRGFDDAWIDNGNRREAQLMNLSPGHYIFEVRGKNYEGVWTPQPASVEIIIHPPFWATWWFRTLMVLSLAGLVWLAYQLRIRQIQAQKTELEHLVTQRTDELRREKEAAENAKQTIEKQARVLEAQKELAERDKATIEKQTRRLLEMDRIKSRFFANISHEFRTPLTLIMSPLEDMLSSDTNTKALDPALSKTLGGIQRNSHRLLRLINQLLDLSKMESGNMQPQLSAGNIIEFTHRIIQSFANSASQKDIALHFQHQVDEADLLFDHDKLEKIYYNLISNALKFTPDDGEISLSLSLARRNGVMPASDWLEIQVKDNGIGIAADKIPHIFDRFFQVDDSSIREYAGSGIGLALTSELIDVLGGEISVESEIGKGTSFTVSLPTQILAKEESSVGDSANGEIPVNGQQHDAEIPTNANGHQDADKTTDDTNGAINILVVEDNQEVQNYICEHLPAQYKVSAASNGQEGLDLAFDIIPDLVISDIMMPKINGYQMCEVLKNDPRTNHIPIIMLTARASDESKLKGLETGADAYLIKPFSLKELRLRVAKLLEQRKKLREQFSKEIYLKPQDVTVNSMDANFLERVCEVIESHMDDCDFSIEALGHEVGMSRPHFHKKMRALTGQSPSQFVRTMRLRRAAQLLEQQGGTVTEVAHGVGFNNLSYFTKCFREQFGVLPSEFGK